MLERANVRDEQHAAELRAKSNELKVANAKMAEVKEHLRRLSFVVVNIHSSSGSARVVERGLPRSVTTPGTPAAGAGASSADAVFNQGMARKSTALGTPPTAAAAAAEVEGPAAPTPALCAALHNLTNNTGV